MTPARAKFLRLAAIMQSLVSTNLNVETFCFNESNDDDDRGQWKID